MRSIKSRTGVLRHARYVIYDRTTGSPKGRESYGDGAFIVVVGVTPHQGGCEIKQPQGEGRQELMLEKQKGMRNANGQSNSTSYT